jgi:probable F420-dependent oxidoreductase
VTASGTPPGCLSLGLVLPHFGRSVNIGTVLRAAQAAERYGFSSVWVRDRLQASAPHGLLLEAGGTTFLEPLLTLAAVSAVTDRIHLGTAVLTPIRNPLKLVQDIGTLCHISRNRVELGVGLGVSEADMSALGMARADRKDLFDEYMNVLLAGVNDDVICFHGRHFSVDAAVVDPRPPSDLPLWYGGTSNAAVRRAFQYGQGWIAGRLPIDTFRQRMGTVDRYRQELGRDIRIATMPITMVGGDRAAARRRVSDVVDTLAHSAEGSSSWVRPPSGSFRTVDDLSGLLIAGNSDDCIEELEKLRSTGINEVIFDLRVAFEGIDDALALLGEEVLPVFRQEAMP